MKPTKLTFAVTALAFTAILGATSPAYAQVDGNLLVGFESAGSTNVYEVELGPVSEFVGDTTPLNFNLSTSDLSSTAYGFGANWATSTGSSAVQWGLIGATSATGGNLFTSWNTSSAAPAALTAQEQTTVGGKVNALDTYADNQPNTPGGTNSQPTAEDQTTDPNSFAYIEKNAPNFGFGAGAGNSQLDYNSDDSIPAADAGVLDLYELTNNGSGTSAGTLLGQFTLASDGDLTFTPEAVPEPTSYVLGLVGVALFFVLRRRASLSA